MDYQKEIDYSSLSTYLECPRKFMFQYMLHLRDLRPNLDLIFGSCWHAGLEVTFLRLMKETLSVEQATELSMAGFNTIWDEEAAPHFDADLTYPKSPGRAYQMYYEYWQRFLADFYEHQIIGVEIPFSIDLSTVSPGLPNYIGRLDLVVQETPQFVIITDHKTAKSVNKATEAGYENSIQTEGYLLAGHMYFDAIPRIRYSVALCQKTKIDFFIFQFTRKRDYLDRFLTELSSHISRLHKDILLLDHLSGLSGYQTDPNVIPGCFPRNNTYACTTYFRKCPYFDICMARLNPLVWVNSDPPAGYFRKEWNPADKDSSYHNLLIKAGLIRNSL